MVGPSRTVEPPSINDLARADAIVREYLPPTPVVDTPVFGPGGLLKLECLQPTGSFKVRGALAAIAALTDDERAAGVVTASAGNAGLGVAYAATRLRVRATVVVPTTAAPAKVAALRRFDIDLILYGDGYAEAERHALDLAERGARFVSAYNDRWVIAGQGSIGSELAERVDGPLTIVTPVGGGGLAAGLALWGSQFPDVRVVGVEAAASMAVSAAMAAGEVVEVPIGSTVADGLAGNIEPNSVTPAMLTAHAHGMVSVGEAAIESAMRRLASEHGLLVEGSGAVAVAALREGLVDVVGRPVAVVTGRNIDLGRAAAILGADDR